MKRKNFIKTVLPILLIPSLALTKKYKRHGIGFEVCMDENMESAIREQIPHYDEIGKKRNNPEITKNAVILWNTLTIQEYWDESKSDVSYELIYDKKGNKIGMHKTEKIIWEEKRKNYDVREQVLYCEVDILI